MYMYTVEILCLSVFCIYNVVSDDPITCRLFQFQITYIFQFQSKNCIYSDI